VGRRGSDVLRRLRASPSAVDYLKKVAGRLVPFEEAADILGLGVVRDLVEAGYASIERKGDTAYLRVSERAAEEVEASPLPRIPRDLFADIEGHESKKAAILMALRSRRPVHVLLAGPPGVAKTLFLLDLARVEGAYYIIGSRLSKAGLTEFLKTYRPYLLIIDEIDKMDWKDQSILLSLMETGIVTVTLKTEVVRLSLNTRVFAACNREDKLDPALYSRFLVLRFTEYTAEEYIKLVPKVLVKREGVDPQLAEYIAASLAPFTRDVRDAIKVARMARTKEEVDLLVAELKKTKRLY